MIRIVFIIIMMFSLSFAQDSVSESEYFENKLRKANQLVDKDQKIRKLDIPEEKRFSTALGEITFGLVIVCGLIIVSIMLLKKVRQKAMGGNATGNDIKIFQNQYIGQSQRLMTVRFENKVLLLGVTNENIRLLDTLEGEGASAFMESNTPEGINSKQLSNTVNNFLQKFSRQDAEGGKR